MEQTSMTAVQNQAKKSSKTSVTMKIGQCRGGGGAVVAAGILILGGAVAAAAFVYNQSQRHRNNGKKGSSQAGKVIQEDKYINEDKGLQFVAPTSSATLDKDQDQDHQIMRNGVHDQKQNGNTMISDETSFFKQDGKGNEKLDVNGKNEVIPDECKALQQEIACARKEYVNGQDMQVNFRGEETKVNSWECKEGSTSNGDLFQPKPMTANISDGCEDVGNNGEDEEPDALNEEQGNGEEDMPCTKSSEANKDAEEREAHFRDLEVTDKFQVSEEEESLKHMWTSEALGVAEEVIVHSEAEGEEEKSMTGEQIQETREKAKLHNLDHPEPQMDTIETSPKCLEDDKSPPNESTPMENSVDVSELDADNKFKAIQLSPGFSEAGFESRLMEIADSPVLLIDEDMIALKEAEKVVTIEEQNLTKPKDDDNNDMDESSTSKKVEESSEGTAELEKIEANDSKEIVELADDEENGEKLDNFATQEMRLQNCNDEKGMMNLTVLERYIEQLGEMVLEATHPQKRRMLVLTIMASSGSLCLYLGMDFLKLCLIFILSMVLFEMQGI